MQDYFDVAFTPTIVELQDQKGSRRIYADRAREPDADGLDLAELGHITARDSFYLASVGESGWPYVQHRGGEPGFVKILGPCTIGWVERNGNRQYVGTGNITATGRVAAIFVDYPNRTRLKLYGNATYHADPTDELLAALDAEEVRNDGVVTVEVVATNWNCPKYLTPRFIEGEVRAAIEPLHERIAELEQQIVDLSPS